MAKYKTLKQERDEAVARAVEAERLSNIEVVRKLETELESVKRERDDMAELARSSIPELKLLAREIWGPATLSLEQIVVRLGVDVGKLCRIARGADKDRELLDAFTLATAMGNIIFSMIRWCDDIKLDPRAAVQMAIECQRKFAEENVRR